jgi:hypothetical protein
MLLSLSDDELQLVHEAVPFDALPSCVRCCKRMRTAAMASGGLALVAAAAGDLKSVKWAHQHACPLSRVEGAGMLCLIAAARADPHMLQWALENGGVGLRGFDVMQLAIAAGSLDMVRVVHAHGVPIHLWNYSSAAITGDLAILQWLQGCVVVEYRRSHRTGMTVAAGFAAAHGHLEVLKWLTVERDDGAAPGETAYWGRYILAAAARGGHVHIIEWAHRFGYPSSHTKQEWARAANQAKAAAESVQRQRAGQPPSRKMSSKLKKTARKRVKMIRKEQIEMYNWILTLAREDQRHCMVSNREATIQ